MRRPNRPPGKRPRPRVGRWRIRSCDGQHVPQCQPAEADSVRYECRGPLGALRSQHWHHRAVQKGHYFATPARMRAVQQTQHRAARGSRPANGHKTGAPLHQCRKQQGCGRLRASSDRGKRAHRGYLRAGRLDCARAQRTHLAPVAALFRPTSSVYQADWSSLFLPTSSYQAGWQRNEGEHQISQAFLERFSRFGRDLEKCIRVCTER